MASSCYGSIAHSYAACAAETGVRARTGQKECAPATRCRAAASGAPPQPPAAQHPGAPRPRSAARPASAALCHQGTRTPSHPPQPFTLRKPVAARRPGAPRSRSAARPASATSHPSTTNPTASGTPHVWSYTADMQSAACAAGAARLGARWRSYAGRPHRTPQPLAGPTCAKAAGCHSGWGRTP